MYIYNTTNSIILPLNQITKNNKKQKQTK